LIEAVKAESYDAFLADADANMKKQLSRQQFEGLCGLYTKPLKQGYTLSYFGQLKTAGHGGLRVESRRRWSARRSAGPPVAQGRQSRRRSGAVNRGRQGPNDSLLDLRKVVIPATNFPAVTTIGAWQKMRYFPFVEWHPRTTH
jgi:hypothetical protein